MRSASFVPATQFSLPSFGAAAFSLVAFGATWAFLPEPDRQAGPARRPRIVGGFVDAARDATLRPLVVAFFVASVAFSGVQIAFVPFVADVYGYDASQAGLLLTYVGVLGVLNQGVVVGRVAQRVSAKRMALVGAGLPSSRSPRSRFRRRSGADCSAGSRTPASARASSHSWAC
ncbi:MAG: MFS transporter [Haloarculaceae archaeon]